VRTLLHFGMKSHLLVCQNEKLKRVEIQLAVFCGFCASYCLIMIYLMFGHLW